MQYLVLLLLSPNKHRVFIYEENNETKNRFMIFENVFLTVVEILYARVIKFCVIEIKYLEQI